MPAQHKRWGHLFALTYVALLGGILPFICWGAWAQPGHPHSRPHFVFFTPESSASNGVSAPDVHHVHADDSQAPATQATPDLLLSLLALGVLVADNKYTYRACYEVRRACHLVPAQTHNSCVPTPPPRLLPACN